MLVTRHEFDLILRRFQKPGLYGLDTETTGLRETDRLFSLILSDEDDAYYFNFNDKPDHLGNLPPEEYILPRRYLLEMADIFLEPRSMWFIHSAKFDMRMLHYEGIEIRGAVWCTKNGARLERNDMLDPDYSLDKCAARLGLKKDDKVAEYVAENKLYTKAKIPGKGKEAKLMHYEKVPFALMSSYALTDAKLHLALGLHQKALFLARSLNHGDGSPPLLAVALKECELTKTAFRMERRGIKIDKTYTSKALAYELQQEHHWKSEFKKATGVEFVDGRTVLVEAFTRLGEKFPLTEAGNPSFAAEVLESMKTPVASMVTKIRDHKRRASTYYSSFLHYADGDSVIHPDMCQWGTRTGRFSYRDPNLQNVPKEDDPEDRKKPYLVRGAFVPREGTCFVSIDYQQQEFRMMLDYAGEKALIKDILEGADVHQATADLVGITRKQAKTINFGLLYGMGVVLLASSLFDATLPEMHLWAIWRRHNNWRPDKLDGQLLSSITPGELEHNLRQLLMASDMRKEYFGKLPGVKRFIKEATEKAAARGYVWDWTGRRYYSSNQELAYKAPNALIQGGCASVIKRAMVQIDHKLAQVLGVRMLLQVHDELLFEADPNQLEVFKEIETIMSSIYPAKNGMTLTTSVEHSFKSWAARDKVKGLPGDKS